jgi:hypothetical protein
MKANNNDPKPDDYIILVQSDYQKCISINNITANLSLTTNVLICTENNQTNVCYEVSTWNDKLKRINKSFTNYTLAYQYYMRVYNKYKKDI